jgi:type IV pilus assembly protein PilW
MIQGNNKISRDRTGYTLVEILVVMLISFIVLGGVYKAITTENIELDKEEIILDMQLNARAALDIIAADIRKTGFLGCAGNLAADTTGNSGPADPIQAHTTAGIVNTDLPILNALRGAAGVDYLGDPLAYVNNAPASHATYQQNTDVLSVRYLSGDEPLQVDMASATSDPKVLATNTFSQGDILYITDCEFYSVFQKTDSGSTQDIGHVTGSLVPGNSSTDLGQVYRLNSRVYNLVVNTYFIQTGSFAISRNRTGDDIAENIEDLQFQYKWDVNNNNILSDDPWSDTYPLAVAAEMGAIRIFVLARSAPVYSYTNTNTYDYPNSPYCSAAGAALFTCSGTALPNDNFYRYLASAEVKLRNSGL